MASRRSPGPAVAMLLVLVMAAGCAGADGTGPPPTGTAPAPDAAQPGPGAVDIALRAAGRPLPDVVGDTVEEARRTLGASGVRAQVVAFDADAAVTAQSPRGGESPPADGVVTVWLGTPPDLPPPPPPTAAPDPAPQVTPEAPAPRDPPADEASGSPEPPAAFEAAAAEAAAPSDEPDTSPRAPARAPADAPSRSRPTGRVLEGPATWYGPGFAGNRTACGGRFDPSEMTMASRELPCGTRVRVTGPSGRSVEVTVTDWGPAEWTGKRFDLSAAAFAEIASLSAGVIPVRVEVLR